MNATHATSCGTSHATTSHASRESLPHESTPDDSVAPLVVDGFRIELLATMGDHSDVWADERLLGGIRREADGRWRVSASRGPLAPSLPAAHGELIPMLRLLLERRAMRNHAPARASSARFRPTSKTADVTSA